MCTWLVSPWLAGGHLISARPRHEYSLSPLRGVECLFFFTPDRVSRLPYAPYYVARRTSRTPCLINLAVLMLALLVLEDGTAQLNSGECDYCAAHDLAVPGCLFRSGL